MRTTETAFPAERVVELNGERYHLASRDQAELAGARQWDMDYQTDQIEAKPIPFAVPVGFHEGGGFVWGDIPGAYFEAHGWDTIPPGQASTWGEWSASTNVDAGTSPRNRGWLIHLEDSIYMCRGRYVTKFTEPNTFGMDISGSETLDLETDLTGSAVGDECGGRPVVFNGKMYVPVVSSAGALKRFGECTPGLPDVWATGPADKLAKFFFNWKELLGRADADNGVATCATVPTTASNWSDDNSTMIEISPPGAVTTDAVQWNEYMFFMTSKGAFTLDEGLLPRLETRDLSFLNDPRNGEGAAVVHGDIMIPTAVGLVRLKPGQKWRTIGPDQEGQMDQVFGTTGRPIAVVPYGQMFFVLYVDRVSGTTSAYMLTPGKGTRQPYSSHPFFMTSATGNENGLLEGATIVSVTTSGQTANYLYMIFTAQNRNTAEIRVFILPSDGAQSPGMSRWVTANPLPEEATLKTAKIYAPSRTVDKTYREVEFFLRTLPVTGDVPPLQVWYQIGEAAAAQCLDSTGAVADVVETNSLGSTHRVFFPKATKAERIELHFIKPPTSPSYSVNVHIAHLGDIVLRGSYVPRQEPIYSVVLVLGPGEFADRGSMRRTTQQQEADLKALTDPDANGGVITYKRERGQTGWATVVSVAFRSVKDREGDQEVRVAILGVREEDYD